MMLSLKYSSTKMRIFKEWSARASVLKTPLINIRLFIITFPNLSGNAITGRIWRFGNLPQFIREFDFFLRIDKECTHNTVWVYTISVISLAKLAIKKGLIRQTLFRIMKSAWKKLIAAIF
nr:phage integrase SAM-like domain-containing protein [Sphingobacterium cavernae]